MVLKPYIDISIEAFIAKLLDSRKKKITFVNFHEVYELAKNKIKYQRVFIKILKLMITKLKDI